jgi:hypothetical protein
MPAESAQWLPVSADELKMTDEPQAAKASAILLYRQVDRDDNGPTERDYYRVKILTEEGRQYANVELAFDNNRETIRDIEARTIRPDGSVIPFDGTVYDKQVAEGQGLNLHAKAFALPDVQVGSIIEYRYTQQLTYGTVFNSQWILSQPLFTKDAKFSLQPYRRFALRFGWPRGLPEGTNPPTAAGGVIRLEAHNIAPFIKEEHMPPENELKYRVDFIYVPHGDESTDPTVFWKKFGQSHFRSVEEFVDESRTMAQAVAQIVAPGDLPEAKLRKIYARVQQLRNLSFEPRKSDQEKDREHQREAKDVADVWQRGYATGQHLTWLFLGLVRAAGLHADPVLVANRDAVFFKMRDLNPAQLNTNVVLVTEGGRELYLDPGAAFTPFGLLPWGKTGVHGLLLDKDGGRWIETPLPAPSDSRIERKADFRLTTSGALTGSVRITYTGLEARACRVHERNEDEAHRKQYLESLIRADVPSGMNVALANAPPNWSDPESPFVAEYHVTIPDWATLTGQRALMPVAVFSGRWKHVFEHAARIHPIYFPFPFEYADEMRVELPPGWAVASLPKAHDTNITVLAYQSAANYGDGALQLRRGLISKVTLVDEKYYDTVRDFFQSVRSGDTEQLILSAGAAGRP